MKRILYMVACDIDLTGTPVFIRDIGKYFENKYEVTVYTPTKQLKNIFGNSITVLEGNCQGGGIKFYNNVKNNIKKIFKEKEFDIIHINTSNIHIANLYVNYFYGKGSLILCHSHNVITYNRNPVYNKLVQMTKRNIVRKSNRLLACSVEAGRTMFGKQSDFTVINNFVDINRFRFSQDFRENIRKKYKFDFILGHIGAFNGQKNQMFIIKLMEKLDDRFCLILIGEGETKESCKQYCRDNGICNVYFIDACDDVYKYYSAFDIFLFPSRFEGFGRVLLEAEVSNLNKIASNNVPQSKAFDCKYLPLDEKKWLMEINKEIHMLNNRTNNFEKVKRNGFDVDSVLKVLVSIYDSKMSKLGRI